MSQIIVQLTREWPPGYGGIERVAHELAKFWEGPVFSLDAKGIVGVSKDPLLASYKRIRLARVLIGRLALPTPTIELLKLLTTNDPLHVHLPCPSVLTLAILARIIKPKRAISVHWHAFLETDNSLSGHLIALYQHLAIIFSKFARLVLTTSPALKDELVRLGCKPDRVKLLPCCIDSTLEKRALKARKTLNPKNQLRILFIGRLDSYKRVDWLLDSVNKASLQLNNLNAFEVIIAGEGPNHEKLVLQSKSLAIPVRFLGRVNEKEKLELLEAADLLVLPSDRSNEAFGIVQLEAMATGTPALAFDLPRSGMSWVCELKGLEWNRTAESLPDALAKLKLDPSLHRKLCIEAKKRYLKIFCRVEWEKRMKRIAK